MDVLVLSICGAMRPTWFEETVSGKQQHNGCNVNNKHGGGEKSLPKQKNGERVEKEGNKNKNSSHKKKVWNAIRERLSFCILFFDCGCSKLAKLSDVPESIALVFSIILFSQVIYRVAKHAILPCFLREPSRFSVTLIANYLCNKRPQVSAPFPPASPFNRDETNVLSKPFSTAERINH